MRMFSCRRRRTRRSGCGTSGNPRAQYTLSVQKTRLLEGSLALARQSAARIFLLRATTAKRSTSTILECGACSSRSSTSRRWRALCGIDHKRRSLSQTSWATSLSTMGKPCGPSQKSCSPASTGREAGVRRSPCTRRTRCLPRGATTRSSRCGTSRSCSAPARSRTMRTLYAS